MGMEKEGTTVTSQMTGNGDFCSIDDLVRVLGAEKIDRKTLFAAARRNELPGTRRISRRLLVHLPTFMGWFTSAGTQEKATPTSTGAAAPVGTTVKPS